MKILHAPTEIAGQMGILSRAQRELGYYSHSCSYANSWAGYKCDECLNFEQPGNKYHKGLRMLRFFLGATRRYDVFHFHFGRTLLPCNVDLPILKALGKKMVMQYWGSDVRQKSIAERNNKFVKVKVENEEQIISNIKGIAKYIDTAIVEDYELHEYVRDYFKKVVVIRQAVALSEYTPVIPSVHTKKPVIVHAPSDKRIKGTEYVLEAISRLEKEHDLKFVLVHGMPHRRAKEIYQRADIIVDQLLGGTYGIFAVEAMALGKPVLCYIREDLRGTYPEELPIVSANPENIYDQLKVLVENGGLRRDLGLRGRDYVERYHDSLKIAKQLIELYESL